MALETTIGVIVHAKLEVIARPWFPVLNPHQKKSAYPGFTASISVAMHLVDGHKL